MGCPNPPSTDELVVKLWGGRGRWGARELALWTDEYTCEGVVCARARVRKEKRKEKAEWRELRGEVNFSRVRSDKDEAASTLSPWKNTRSTVSMVARTCACPIVPISRLVKVSRFLLTLSPYPREDLVFLGRDGTLDFSEDILPCPFLSILRDQFLRIYYYFSSYSSPRIGETRMIFRSKKIRQIVILYNSIERLMRYPLIYSYHLFLRPIYVYIKVFPIF